MSAQVAQDLRAAAEVLRRDGWMRGDLGTCDGPKCAVGVAYYVASDGAEVVYEFSGSDTIHRAERIADAVADEIGVGRQDLPTWNDAPERTADEVIAALEAAADAAEAQS
jgi:hypothetical protein